MRVFVKKCSKKISLLTANTSDKESTIKKEVNSNISSANKIAHESRSYNPKQIKQNLDLYVIGQDNAKKIMSVAVCNHLKRIELMKNDNVIIDKSNILMIGPTGSGKTHIIKSLAKSCDLPFVIVDATTFTEAGYVGADVESIVQSLLQECNNDVEKASKGIVFIDEVDKLGRRQDVSSRKGVGSEGVQQALLKLIEGKKVTVPSIGKDNKGNDLIVDTTNMLFICGGAFPEMKNIILDRLKDCSLDNIYEKLIDEDLVQFGIIPELIGRLPVVAVLEEISIEMFKQILTVPKDSIISQYKMIFSYDNLELEFTESSLDKIAAGAAMKKRGARALRTILEELLLDYMYELPGSSVKSLIIDVIDNQFRAKFNIKGDK